MSICVELVSREGLQVDVLGEKIVPITGFLTHPWAPYEPHDHPAWHPEDHRMGRWRVENDGVERYRMERACAFGERLVS